jgi:vacuolar-type H+-ATPase subunit H
LTSVVEETVKALMEFESALDLAKGEASEARKKLQRDAADWSASAKASALQRAQQIASERVAKARSEAEAEAESIRKKGEAASKSFEAAIAKQRSKAAGLVARRLMGEEE